MKENVKTRHICKTVAKKINEVKHFSATSYRELQLFAAFILHIERPPAFDPAVFEQRHLGHRAVRLDHVQGALPGRLGAARETVQVKGQRACQKKRILILLFQVTSKRTLKKKQLQSYYLFKKEMY